jgi:hypothetical protein
VRAAVSVAILLAMIVPTTIEAQAGPIAIAADRLARAQTSQPAGGGAARPPVSRAEKLAWAYLLIGGSVFIATSPGEKDADGRWSNDGKWEMAAGIGAVGLSFGLLHDIVKSSRGPTPAR